MAVLLCLSACTQGPQRPGRTIDNTGMPIELNAASISQFDDIPVPHGFKLLGNKSFSYKTKTIRVAVLTYTGNARMEDTIAFYEDQMSVSGWQFISNMGPGNSKTLDFKKETETANITISEDGLNCIIEIRLR